MKKINPPPVKPQMAVTPWNVCRSNGLESPQNALTNFASRFYIRFTQDSAGFSENNSGFTQDDYGFNQSDSGVEGRVCRIQDPCGYFSYNQDLVFSLTLLELGSLVAYHQPSQE